MSADLPEIRPPMLNSKLVTTQFDDANRILIVRYYGELTSESTKTFYEWAIRSALEYGIDFIHGTIYDFSEVKKFTRSNLTATQRGSLSLNAKADFSQLPVALVAKTMLQEQHLSIALAATPGEDRKKVVRSIQEGITFIEQWHMKQRDETKKADTAHGATNPTATSDG